MTKSQLLERRGVGAENQVLYVGGTFYNVGDLPGGILLTYREILDFYILLHQFLCIMRA